MRTLSPGHMKVPGVRNKDGLKHLHQHANKTQGQSKGLGLRWEPEELIRKAIALSADGVSAYWKLCLLTLRAKRASDCCISLPKRLDQFKWASDFVVALWDLDIRHLNSGSLSPSSLPPQPQQEITASAGRAARGRCQCHILHLDEDSDMKHRPISERPLGAHFLVTNCPSQSLSASTCAYFWRLLDQGLQKTSSE